MRGRTLRALLLAVAVYALAGACLPARAGFTSRVTYYPIVGWMANGDWTHDGAAACPRAYLGAWVHILGPNRWYQCEDTGGAPWYFEAGGFPVDVYSPTRPAWMTADWYEIEVVW